MKYIGSKARLSKSLAPIINTMIEDNNITDYIEVFVGGANMIQHIVCNNKTGYDKNEYLISMWNELQGGYIPPKLISKDLYNSIKDNKSKYPKELVSIAGFCSTYNAKWFGGYAGIVVTKDGNTRNYYDESVRNIMKQLPHIMDVDFKYADYRDLDFENTLIYCDPPYKEKTQYRDVFDSDAFWNWAREQSKKNIVLVSEYDAPDDFEPIFEQALTTTLDKNSRQKNIEKLFMIKG